MSRTELRQKFLKLREWRLAWGDWSEADAAEVGESIRLALESKSEAAANAAAAYLDAELVGISRMEQRVVSAVEAIRARSRQLRSDSNGRI